MLNFKERNYKIEKQNIFTKVINHPLEKNSNLYSKSINRLNLSKEGSIGNKSNSKTIGKVAYVDPLSNISPLEISELDETSKMKCNNNIEPWSSKRLNILTTFTTSEKLTIVSSFLINKPDEEVRIINKPSSSSIIDKMKSKLEQLDDYEGEEVKETSNLNVQQFTEKINELQIALKTSWRDGHRVKTLQIVIQSTKLLSESTVAQFFPSKFVLVTDLIDTFGFLVFERLKLKSAYTPRGAKVSIPLINSFNESQVPETAKETAKNWFYKVASIRELVARLYVEATLLPCYKFFDSASIPFTLMRLIISARGIGDPLLATYARAYIVRVGVTIHYSKNDYIEQAFDDTLHTLKTLAVNYLDNNINHLTLFVPAVDWILSCLCSSASDDHLDIILSKIERTKNPLLLHSALNSISTTYIEKKTLHFAEMINDLAESSYPKYIMYKQLGACVSLSFSFGEDKALQLMRYVWKYITKLTEPRHFIECADAWAEFVAMNFDSTYINRFIAHITKEMIRDNLYQEFYNQLQSILSKIISCKCNFENLFTAPEFTQFLSLFDKEHIVIEIRQVVIERFFGSIGDQVISDPVLIQGCMRLLKEMNDSLNSLSVIDDKRLVCKLILILLNRIKFEGKHVEQELDLLTQFRSTFGGMEVVIYNIVERVNNLAMRVLHLRPNHEHNSGSASFVRACMAFNFITIPSIEDIVLAIRLYTTSAQVALINSCLGQAEACIKEAISLLSKLDYDKSIDRTIDPACVVELAANIASTLLMCPDINFIISDDENKKSQQILYMMKGLINAVNLCPMIKTDHIVTQKSLLKGDIFIKILLALAAFSQPDYIYHADKTDSNDKIYGGSDQFLQVVSEMFSVVVSKIISLKSDKVNELLKHVLTTVIEINDEEHNSQYHEWIEELS